jgi:hypothetical protein
MSDEWQVSRAGARGCILVMGSDWYARRRNRFLDFFFLFLIMWKWIFWPGKIPKDLRKIGGKSSRWIRSFRTTFVIDTFIRSERILNEN